MVVDADKNEVRTDYDDLEALPDDVVSTIPKPVVRRTCST